MRNRSQIQRLWIVSDPFQVQFGTGEGRLTENINKILAGLLGRRWRKGRRDERMMDHFGNAVEHSTAQTFLNELFVFRSELDRHDSTLRRRNRAVNSLIYFGPIRTGLHVLANLSGVAPPSGAEPRTPPAAPR